MESTTAPVELDVSMTGDEAYARRLAMSQGRVATVTVPEPIVSSVSAPPPPIVAPTKQPSPEPPTLAYNPFAPPIVPPPPPPVDFDDRVKNSRETAAAIAARLSKIAAASSDPEATGNQLEADISTEKKYAFSSPSQFFILKFVYQA